MTAIAMADQGRRQTVTVLFIDIVGFTSLVDDLDCAVVRALQRDYFSTVSAVVQAGGGVVEKYVGTSLAAIQTAIAAHQGLPMFSVIATPMASREAIVVQSAKRH